MKLNSTVHWKNLRILSNNHYLLIKETYTQLHIANKKTHHRLPQQVLHNSKPSILSPLPRPDTRNVRRSGMSLLPSDPPLFSFSFPPSQQTPWIDTPPNESKSDKIECVKANLPLLDDPLIASDWNSADARKVKYREWQRAG